MAVPLCIPTTVRAHLTRDGLLLLDMTSGEFYVGNPTAAAIWRLVEEHGDAALVNQELLSQGCPASIAATSNDFIQDLVNRGFLASASREGPSC